MLLVDRDGVIIEEGEYLADPARVVLLPGAARLLRQAKIAGFDVVVVSNQSGICRGLFGWGEFLAVQIRLATLLAQEGAEWDAALACPYHPEGGHVMFASDHSWRKPNPGMVLQAARSLEGDISRSVLIGDKLSDLQAGHAAGVPVLCHVLTGHGRAERAKVEAWPHRAELLSDLTDASFDGTRGLVLRSSRKPA